MKHKRTAGIVFCCCCLSHQVWQWNARQRLYMKRSRKNLPIRHFMKKMALLHMRNNL